MRRLFSSLRPKVAIINRKYAKEFVPVSEEYRKFLEEEINRLENEILQQGKLIERIEAFRSVLVSYQGVQESHLAPA